MLFGRIKALYFKTRNHVKTEKETAFLQECRTALESLKHWTGKIFGFYKLKVTLVAFR